MDLTSLRRHSTLIVIGLGAALVLGVTYFILFGPRERFKADDLARLVLVKEDLGETYAHLSFAPELSGEITNRLLGAVAFDQEAQNAEGRAILMNDRKTGYAQAYTLRTDAPVSSGVVYFFSQVDSFAGTGGATRYFADLKERPQHVNETSRHGVTILAALRYDPGAIGEEAAGTRTASAYVAGALGEVVVYTTTITFRRGQLIGTVGVDRADPADVRQELAALAQKLDQSLQKALASD